MGGTLASAMQKEGDKPKGGATQSASSESVNGRSQIRQKNVNELKAELKGAETRPPLIRQKNVNELKAELKAADPTPPGHMGPGQSLTERVESRAYATTQKRHPEDYKDYTMHPIAVPGFNPDEGCARVVLTPRRTHTDGVYQSRVTGKCSEGHGDHVKDLDITRESGLAMLKTDRHIWDEASIPVFEGAMTMLDGGCADDYRGDLSQAVDYMADEFFRMKGTEPNPKRVEHLKKGCDHSCEAAAIIRTPSLNRVTAVVHADEHDSLRRVRVEGFTPLTPRSSAARIIKEQGTFDMCIHSHAAKADDAEMHAT